MKPVQRSAIFGALLACSGAVFASSVSLNEFHPKVMPVLVQVNSDGHVTDASPAMELTPQLRRLLHANLDEMISGPAIDTHGRPRSSQFIMNLALQASPKANGNFDAHFTCLSTAPVPAGSWYWVHVDGHRLALARQGSDYRRQQTPPAAHQPRESSYPSHRQQSPTPSINNTSRSVPAPLPPRSP